MAAPGSADPGRGRPADAAVRAARWDRSADSRCGELNLTESQREQVQGDRRAAREAETRAVGERAMAARQALHAAITPTSFDEGLVRARAAELASVEADLAVSRARIYADVFQILTPEHRRRRRRSGGSANRPDRTSTAVTMWFAEIPKRSSSSSGLPLRGISRTAIRWTRMPASPTASATASPIPPAA